MLRSFVRTKKLAAWAVGSLMLIVQAPAGAWDGAVSGVISAIEVTHGGNFGFRIFVSGTSAMCTSGPGWGYLNETDSNYKAYAAALMMAKAQGSSVTIYSTLESGYCHIGYVTIT